MSFAKTLYFVRHGQTDWNASRRMQGQRNSSLDVTGRAQADGHGRLLAECSIDALYASPLERARQTVEIIRRHIEPEARFDSRVMEWDCGDWSGHLHDDVRTRWADEWAALQADPFHYRGPNCENYPDMIERVSPFLAELIESDDERIAVVSHGMIGRVMIGVLMRYEPDDMLALHQANDVVYRVELDPGSMRTPRLAHYLAGAGPIAGYRRRTAEPERV